MYISSIYLEIIDGSAPLRVVTSVVKVTVSVHVIEH